MTSVRPAPPSRPAARGLPLRPPGRARTAALLSLGAWGALHVVGGLALAVTAAADSGHAALQTLGSAAPAAQLPDPAGPVVEALIGFHGFNIAVAGAAVLWLAAGRARRAWPAGVSPALALVVVLDVGLVAFLLAPGHMLVADGMFGPVLAVVAVAASLAAGWRPRTPAVGER